MIFFQEVSPVTKLGTFEMSDFVKDFKICRVFGGDVHETDTHFHILENCQCNRDMIKRLQACDFN